MSEGGTERPAEHDRKDRKTVGWGDGVDQTQLTSTGLTSAFFWKGVFKRVLTRSAAYPQPSRRSRRDR